MPGFDVREFPLVVGVNDYCSYLLLVNLRTEETMCISRVVKQTITDLMLTYKLKPESSAASQGQSKTLHWKDLDEVTIHFLSGDKQRMNYN